MNKDQYHSFQYNLEKINTSLKKIIELLELRNSIEVARDEMKGEVITGPSPIIVSRETARTTGNERSFPV